jgi:hypothetical protein
LYFLNVVDPLWHGGWNEGSVLGTGGGADAIH